MVQQNGFLFLLPSKSSLHRHKTLSPFDEVSYQVCQFDWGFWFHRFLFLLRYPIYHIPNINDRDLSACFLTYHTLSSTFAGTLPYNCISVPFQLSWANAISKNLYKLYSASSGCAWSTTLLFLLACSIQELDQIFLSFLGAADNHDELSDKILLAPFGIAIYKMQGDLWIKSGTTEYMKFVDLQRAASSWLKQLNVYHHDSSFFACRSSV